jgi:5-(carboxyamino)imidazole ribonucleotide synthase
VRVGVVGGGQLGAMLAEAAAPPDIDCVLVDPVADAPLEHGERVATAFDDPLAFSVLSGCDVVTVELEGVPVDVLERLAAITAVRPPPGAVAVSQDRLVEKDHFTSVDIPTAPYIDAGRAPSRAATDAIVKSRRGGYDGRGQIRVAKGGDVDAAVRALDRPAIVEEQIAFDRELSIVAARAVDGTMACYPLVENHHAEGILRTTIAPAPGVAPSLQALAEKYITALAESLDYVGVLALELFQVGDRLLANEMAPRVHNSGHWTIEGAATSQFTLHLLAVTGQALGACDLAGGATMVNLIGELPDPMPAGPGVFVHLYGKAPRPGRKLGHVTTVARGSR